MAAIELEWDREAAYTGVVGKRNVSRAEIRDRSGRDSDPEAWIGYQCLACKARCRSKHRGTRKIRVRDERPIVPEESPVVAICAHPVPTADYRFRSPPVGKSHARNELSVSHVNAIIQRSVTVSANEHIACRGIEKLYASVVCAGKRIVFPSQAEIHRQVGSCLPTVADVPRPRMPP